jgi:hypothetical protein
MGALTRRPGTLCPLPHRKANRRVDKSVKPLAWRSLAQMRTAIALDNSARLHRGGRGGSLGTYLADMVVGIDC